MQRKSISQSEYEAILEELVITRMQANVMSMTSGKHRDYGRVVLLQSSTSFVIIADNLASLQRHHQVGAASEANAQRAEAVNSALLWNSAPSR